MSGVSKHTRSGGMEENLMNGASKLDIDLLCSSILSTLESAIQFSEMLLFFSDQIHTTTLWLMRRSTIVDCFSSPLFP